jgi:hypothetical protein
MLTIRKEQMTFFEDYFLNKYIREMLNSYPESNYGQIRSIITEAFHYHIESEDLVSEYIDLYITNPSSFESKPAWMINTLQNEIYSAEDKLEHIERTLTEE